MKKTTVTLACLVAAATLGSVSTFAADSKPATGKVAFTTGGAPGTNGLYLESVSNLDFGSKVISLGNEDYTTSGNKFEVVDLTGVYPGWNLQVKQGAQFATRAATPAPLVGAELSLTGITADGNGVGTAPGTVATLIEFGTFDQNYRVVSAAANQGKGKWGYDHGSNLHVPGTALPEAAEYTTNLTWSLISGPAS